MVICPVELPIRNGDSPINNGDFPVIYRSKIVMFQWFTYEKNVIYPSEIAIFRWFTYEKLWFVVLSCPIKKLPFSSDLPIKNGDFPVDVPIQKIIYFRWFTYQKKGDFREIYLSKLESFEPRISLPTHRAARYRTSKAKCDPPGDPSGPAEEEQRRLRRQL